MSLRLVAYLFALAVITITVPFTLAAHDQGLVAAVLGGTLAMTPYVVVRAFEEVANESVPLPREGSYSVRRQIR